MPIAVSLYFCASVVVLISIVAEKRVGTSACHLCDLH